MLYTVVTSKNTDSLASEVTELLKQGWTLAGGVSVAMDQGYTQYAQALTKQ
jgi:hypothetical protein